jgi:hypothetical protein
MLSAQPSPLTLPSELEAEMTPAVRSFVESLLDRIKKLEARLGMNPQNSSLPPGDSSIRNSGIAFFRPDFVASANRPASTWTNRPMGLPIVYKLTAPYTIPRCGMGKIA